MSVKFKSGHWTAKRIPFGAAVDFLPNSTKKKWAGRSKWNPNAIPGIFLGYKLLPGRKWKGEYYVASLKDCQSLDLSCDARKADSRLPVHRRGIVVEDALGYRFPLKARYDQTNGTLERAPPQPGAAGDPFALPPVAGLDPPPRPPDPVVSAADAAVPPVDGFSPEGVGFSDAAEPEPFSDLGADVQGVDGEGY